MDTGEVLLLAGVGVLGFFFLRRIAANNAAAPAPAPDPVATGVNTVASDLLHGNIPGAITADFTTLYHAGVIPGVGGMNLTPATPAQTSALCGKIGSDNFLCQHAANTTNNPFAPGAVLHFAASALPAPSAQTPVGQFGAALGSLVTTAKG